MTLKIYVHAGTHKTGSTSIQNVCAHNRAILLKEGFHYGSSSDSSGHHDLAFFLQKSDFEKASQYIDKEVAFAKDNDCHTLILSSEEFEFLGSRDRVGFFSRFDNVNVLFYLRRQDELIEKEYDQIVKMPTVKYDKDIFKFYMEKWFHSRLNYQNLLANWQEKYSVRALSYNKLVACDGLLESFFHEVGFNKVDELDMSSSESNRSLPARSSIYLSRLNMQYDLSRAQHMKAIEFLSGRFSGLKETLLPMEFRRVILNNTRFMNRIVLGFDDAQLGEYFSAEKYINFNVVDYYEDFDLSIYEQLIEYLYETDV